MDIKESQQPRSASRNIITSLLLWSVPLLGYAVFVGLLFSPRFSSHLDSLFGSRTQLDASARSCELIRNGRFREHAILCDVTYNVQGLPYTARRAVWSSQSPFVTAGALHQVLLQQSAQTARRITIRPSRPEDPAVVDPRWIAMPALWALFTPLIVALFALAIYLEPAATVYRRADLIEDPVSGQLVERNGARKIRVRRLAGFWCCIVLLAMLGCVYGLSNRLANQIAIAGFTRLQPTPAQLHDCGHHFHGSSKGHDQIECAFGYRWQGQALQGRAESVDFRFFPTDARMDAMVQQVEGRQVTAYVDPQYPGYAWAFIDNAWLPVYAWGIFELMLLILLLIVFPALLVSFGRKLVD